MDTVEHGSKVERLHQNVTNLASLCGAACLLRQGATYLETRQSTAWTLSGASALYEQDASGSEGSG